MRTKDQWPVVYLSGAITGNADSSPVRTLLEVLRAVQCEVVCEHVATIGPQGGAPGLDPLADAASIHGYDMGLMARASAVVAEVSTKSFGVGYELREAWHLGIPVLAVCPDDAPEVSAIIRGAPHVTVVRYRDRVELERVVAAFVAGIADIAPAIPAKA